MIGENEIIKRIFGFKIKYLRQQKGLSLQQLAELADISVSYLHDLEKGKKYPKIDKINDLAHALGVGYDFLVSMQADKKLQPLIELLRAEFVQEFPLEVFGLSTDALFELFSNAPDKVTAFISTILKVTRNYQMQREHLYLAALRSYQDMHDNYFPELEQAACTLSAEQDWTTQGTPTAAMLEGALHQRGIAVDHTKLAEVPELQQKRAYFSAAQRVVFLHQQLSAAQQKFLLARELGFDYLALRPRPYLTRMEEVPSFEALLNNFKASYFAVALLMRESDLTADVRDWAGQAHWDPQMLLGLLDKYAVTPEMLLQRLTNILPHHFGLKDLFFIRLTGEQDLRYFRMTKELHLSQLHQPYANEMQEHYCRRWVSVNIIKNLRAQQQLEGQAPLLAEAQVSHYWQTEQSYLCLSIAKADAHQPQTPVSVTVGLLLTDTLRRYFRFLDDPQLPQRTVHTTCERCGIAECEARAVPPAVLEKRHQQLRAEAALAKLDQPH